MRSVITGTGSFIPPDVIDNSAFATRAFYDERHHRIAGASEEIVRKFEKVTGISARRYAEPELNASDMATLAAQAAITDSGVDAEKLDYIIVAHNFGNVDKDTIQSAAVPSLASKVKQNLQILNPGCVAYDLLFGCPGWIQGMIQADCFIKSGQAKRCLVIGAETLSRVIDPFDRDSMIFSDGGGAVILEAADDTSAMQGILGFVSESHCIDEVDFIKMGKSNFPDSDPKVRYMKMAGRKVYEFALSIVPKAMKACVEVCGLDITTLSQIFIHQANEKMDTAIVKEFFALYNMTVVPEFVMPMNIRELGNSSVATVPTLFDMVRKGKIPNHSVKQGDVIMFASVGAGMNVNAMCYRY